MKQSPKKKEIAKVTSKVKVESSDESEEESEEDGEGKSAKEGAKEEEGADAETAPAFAFDDEADKAIIEGMLRVAHRFEICC